MYFFLQARSVIMHAFQSLIFVQKKKKRFLPQMLKKGSGTPTFNGKYNLQCI